FDALAEKKSPARIQFALERLRHVVARMNLLASALVIGQFHHVIEIALIIVAPDVQHIDLAFVRARDRLELQDASKLPLERPLTFEGRTVNDLRGAKSAGETARQPYFAVTSSADDAY